MSSRRRRRIVATVREIAELFKRLDAAALYTAWPSAREADDRSLEQRIRRLEQRGVMHAARAGRGPLDPHLFDETAVLSVRLFFRLLVGGVRPSIACALVEGYQDRIRSVVEEGADLVAFVDRPLQMFGFMPAKDIDRGFLAKRAKYITRIHLRDLAAETRRELRALRRRTPQVWAHGKRVDADALMPASA